MDPVLQILKQDLVITRIHLPTEIEKSNRAIKRSMASQGLWC